MKITLRAVLFLFVCGFSAQAKTLKIQELQFQFPAGWKLHQQALDHQTQLLGFELPEGYVNFFVTPASTQELQNLVSSQTLLSAQSSFTSPSQLKWEWREALHANQNTTLFALNYLNHRYYGYSHAASAERSRQQVTEFLSHLKPLNPKLESLTGPDFTGKKYYVGFGDHLSGFMGNEVKYDIGHTHDVFTHELGGNYLGTKLVGKGIGEEALNEKWASLKKEMTDKDMYIQYSSGHGSHVGLMFGPSYRAIRDNALAYPAKEIIIFTMSCYSGNLVDAFNEKKDEWKDWQAKGRTLMVMSSSGAQETSSTGPGNDVEEPNGPNGSAGSAFGHALWKALIGHADGAVDGITDGYLSLAEIREFTRKKTEEVGGHTPTITGAYNDNLQMVKVPKAEYLSSLQGGTDGLTDGQIMQRIRELNAEWALR